MLSDYVKPVIFMLLGIVCFSVTMASPSAAREKSNSGSNIADSLNEQELRALSTAPPPVSCGSQMPTSLFAFTHSNQNKKNNENARSCDKDEYEKTGAPPVWTLFSGGLVGQQIINWGKSAGWHVIWLCGEDWIVPSSVAFHGAFVPVTEQILEDLAAEGASIHGVFYNGNHTLVITGGNQ